MNPRSSNHQTQAFTRMELLVVVITLGVATLLLIPACDRARQRAERITCVSNLKTVSTTLRFTHADSGYDSAFELLAAKTNISQGFSPFDRSDSNDVWKIVQATRLTGSISPKVLVCPADQMRTPADSFGTNGQPNEFSFPSNRLVAFSYFISLEAVEGGSRTVQLGDRYLTTDPEGKTEKGTKFLFGQQDIGGNSPTSGSVRWISTIHGGGGNAAFMDGSAQQLTTSKLRQALTNQTIAANRIWLPNSDATGRGNP